MKNAWDYQLMLACMRFNLLTAVPALNLVSNLGYGPDATHCYGTNSLAASVEAHGLKFPLVHPEKPESSPQVDYRIFRRRFHEYVWLRLAARVPGLYSLLKPFS